MVDLLQTTDGKVVIKHGGDGMSSPENVDRSLELSRNEKIVAIITSACGSCPPKYTIKETNILEDIGKGNFERIDEVAEMRADNFAPHLVMHESEIAKKRDEIIKSTRTELTTIKELKGKLPETQFRDLLMGNGERKDSPLYAAALELRVGKGKVEYVDDIIWTTGEFQNAGILRISESKTRKRIDTNSGIKYVIPGYIGRTLKGEETTLGRNTSDLTGMFIAYVLGKSNSPVKLYITYKKEDGIKRVDPKIDSISEIIKRMTVRELRNLSGLGDYALHPKVAQYLSDSNVIMNIRSFLPGSSVGTYVEKERIISANEIFTGLVASKIYYVYVKKPGLNEMKGVMRRMLRIMERKYLINTEQYPGSMDEQAIIFKLTGTQLDEVGSLDNLVYDIKKVAGEKAEVYVEQHSSSLIAAGQALGEPRNHDIGSEIAILLNALGIGVGFEIKSKDKDYYIYEIPTDKALIAVKSINQVYLKDKLRPFPEGYLSNLRKIYEQKGMPFPFGNVLN
jgi:bifunctional aspartokinase / homoserine dehydrogenase 1